MHTWIVKGTRPEWYLESESGTIYLWDFWTRKQAKYFFASDAICRPLSHLTFSDLASLALDLGGDSTAG